jgi:hypothetical protein
VLDYPDEVKVVFRQRARSGRSACGARPLAAGQREVLAVPRRLFANPSALDDGSLARIATDLRLDMEQWNRTRGSQNPRGSAKNANAGSLGAPGTPASS